MDATIPGTPSGRSSAARQHRVIVSAAQRGRMPSKRRSRRNSRRSAFGTVKIA